jgi:hypothetical protein
VQAGRSNSATRDQRATAMIKEGRWYSAPHHHGVQDRQRAYVQVVLPSDLIARSPDWNWTEGWPLLWPNIPSVPFAAGY